MEQVEESTAMFTCFMAGKDDIAEEGKKVLKNIPYESARPEVQKALQVSRAQEWLKFERFESFGAVVPLTPDQVQELVTEDIRSFHPSGWMLTKLSTRKAEIQTISPSIQEPVGMMR